MGERPDSSAGGVDHSGRIDGITQWDVCVDGIFIKQISIPKDILIPQHTHTYDHHSMLAKGRVMVWRDDENMGVFDAPMPIFIRAGVRHTFLAMEDALIYCIHNLHGKEDVEILAQET